MAAANDRGFTLVELLVVVFIFGIVGSIVTAGIISALESAAQTNAKIEALNELEIASQRLTRDFRAAETVNVLEENADREIELELLDEAGVTQTVTYIVEDDGRLLRVDTGQILVTSVGNAADEPVFTYLDATGDVLPDCPEISCVGLSQIGLRLVRDIPHLDLNPVIVQTRTSIRNVRYGSSS